MRANSVIDLFEAPIQDIGRLSSEFRGVIAFKDLCELIHGDDGAKRIEAVESASSGFFNRSLSPNISVSHIIGEIFGENDWKNITYKQYAVNAVTALFKYSDKWLRQRGLISRQDMKHNYAVEDWFVYNGDVLEMMSYVIMAGFSDSPWDGHSHIQCGTNCEFTRQLLCYSARFQFMVKNIILCAKCTEFHLRLRDLHLRTRVAFKMWRVWRRIKGNNGTILRCIIAEISWPSNFDAFEAYLRVEAPIDVDLLTAIYDYMRAKIV